MKKRNGTNFFLKKRIKKIKRRIKMSLKANLTQAKTNKKDEFYTQLKDIENELRHYKIN